MLDRARSQSALDGGEGLSNIKPDMVVLDSAEQAQASPVVRSLSPQLENACGAQAVCPAFIPHWVSGEKLEASQQVLRAFAGGG